MKLMRNRQSGQILILVLILLALGPLLVIPMLRQGATSLKYHQIIEQDTLNAYSADAGIQNGYYEVYNDPEAVQGTGFTESRVINNTTVDIAVSYNATLGAYKITSTATSPDNKSTTIESYVLVDIGLFGNAFACEGDINIIHSDLYSDSEGGCDVYVNGNVDVDQSNIDGEIFASGTIDVDEHSSVIDTHEGEDVLAFPDIDVQPHIDAAQEGEWRDEDLVLDGGSHTLGPIYIMNGHKLEIKDNAEVTLAGTVYVEGDVSIVHSDISGYGDLVATGSISFDHFTYTTNATATLPLILSTSGDIAISQGESPGEDYDIEAVLYAPEGKIDLNGDSSNIMDVRGSVAAETITVNYGNIHYPAAVKGRPDLPGAGLAPMTYGYK